MTTKNLVLITGPTAIGKTSCGIELAKKFKSEIISADSRQFYREMTIGTAVPSKDELDTIPHHFIQHMSVFDYYNASKFEIDALNLLQTLFAKHNVVFMVGGSTLYVDTFCYGIDDLPTVDDEIRQMVTSNYEKEGIEYLRRELKILDPDHYEKVDLSNPARIMKAIEISLMTGRPYSTFLTSARKKRDFNIIKIGLNCDREILYNRINLRVDKMIESGLTSEVKSLEYARSTNALRTVGYRELFSYFDNEISLNQAIEQIKVNTRRYAKRQLTWFNRNSEIKWFNPEALNEMGNYILSQLV